jgi:hypothetical protein
MNTTTPQVHLNGTSGDDLLNKLRDAMDAVDKAKTALVQCTPHGRDYYNLPANEKGEAALTLASREHVVRLKRLEDTYDELQDIAIKVMDQIR